ncbi:hypothetical protein NP493_1468g00059 [Ridgeia piscesae]|uniref:Uncharacterized protein n=1 Tax=Ridgeia piscesae TaxID=27915 RepID=A0AAD9NCM9_RIDPI|nr:hypothetical protein NP493_1468g00059 [Ridgeia piscesae]
MSYLPSNNSFTSRDDFSPSARRALSILFDRSCATLSSLLIAQPMLGWLVSRRNNKCRAPTAAARPTNKNKLHHTPITNNTCVAFIVSRRSRVHYRQLRPVPFRTIYLLKSVSNYATE